MTLVFPLAKCLSLYSLWPLYAFHYASHHESHYASRHVGHSAAEAHTLVLLSSCTSDYEQVAAPMIDTAAAY